jgi:hypothetical protein
MSSGNSAFHDYRMYPELAGLRVYAPFLHEEGMAALDAMLPIDDARSPQGAWRALPLRVEDEDLPVISAAACEANRARVPRAASLLLQRPGILACSFSALEPGGRIAPHRHENPYATASLCLTDGGGSFIIADGERRDYRTGDWIVFDYRALHEVFNTGSSVRLVVLLLLPLRTAAMRSGRRALLDGAPELR